MKIDDLVTFIEVAKAPSLRSAAKRLGMQPGTVSKVIKRIEAHYQQALFERRGNRWALTLSGEMMFQRATEMVAISEKIERELGRPRRPHLRISGSETLLSHFVPTLMQRFAPSMEPPSLEIRTADDLTLLRKQEVDLALVAGRHGNPPGSRHWVANAISDVRFVTVANRSHPLWVTGKREVAVAELLKHPFVVPSRPIFGSMDSERSHDGWHDEAFSRLIHARVDTAAMMLALVQTQPLLAYLPDYIANDHNLPVISVSDCPYTCEQTIWLCRHAQMSHHWMRVFE